MNRVIRIAQISMPLSHTEEQVYEKACRAAHIDRSKAARIRIVRKSVDARKKKAICYSYTVDIEIGLKVRYDTRRPNVSEITPTVYAPAVQTDRKPEHPVAVIGAGPAGLFCAFLLARAGLAPLILERGKAAEERQEDVERFWRDGVLDPESNVQFGEGGAGTFSDGKLNTMVKDPYGRGRFVLETLASFGAPPEILYLNKPHIGTDILRGVIVNLRREIIRLGGCFRFSSKVTDFNFERGTLTALKINDGEWIPVSDAVLAVGHSARDTFSRLYERNVPMSAKAFAVGVRVEHPQEMIDLAQYGMQADKSLLPSADYKLACQAPNGRSVYTFCMCPGGYVVNASSEQGMLAVNGMSCHGRDSGTANSAVIVSVTPRDFETGHPLAGVAFQRELEKKAWELAGGRIPRQLFADFEQGRASIGYGGFSGCHRGDAAFADVHQIFPEEIRRLLIFAMHTFAGKIRGFDRPDTILSGVESRTSSPVRIWRGETFESEIGGLYPCGEGAGYAGGIMSAAMDGLKVAEAILRKYTRLPLLENDRRK